MTRKRNAIIREISYNDVSLPDVKIIESYGDDIEKEYDLFITSLGFEDRCLAISNLFFLKKIVSTKVLVAKYIINEVDNIKNQKNLYEKLNKCSNEIYSFDANVSSSIKTVINKSLEDIGKNNFKIALDISTASSQLILSILSIILDSKHQISLDVYYAEPQDYFPQKNDYLNHKNDYLESALKSQDDNPLHEAGVLGVFNNDLYSGYFSESGSSFVIAIPSYKMERLGRCLQQIDDQILTNISSTSFWIFGLPPKDEYKWRSDFQKEIVSKYIGKFSNLENINSENSTQCSTLDYKEVFCKIIDKVDEKLGCNIYVVPMGSKMQTLGIGLALSIRQECAVMHASPTAFNPKKYSVGIGDIWLTRFNSVSLLKKTIQKIGQLEFQPLSDE